MVVTPMLQSIPDRTDQPIWGLSRGKVCVVHHPPLSQPPIRTNPSVRGPEHLPSARQWCEEVCRGVQWCWCAIRWWATKLQHPQWRPMKPQCPQWWPTKLQRTLGFLGWYASWRIHPWGRYGQLAFQDWLLPRRRCPFQSPLQSVSLHSPLQSPLRSVSPRSLLQSPLHSMSPWSLLRSVSLRSPLQSPLRSRSPQSPLHSMSPWSLLRSVSLRSPLQSPLREPTEPLRSGSPQSLLRSGSPQSPLWSWTPHIHSRNRFGTGAHRIRQPKKKRSSQCYLLHPGGILLCWPCLDLLLCLSRPGTPVCLFLRALFHSTGLAHHPYPRSASGPTPS